MLSCMKSDTVICTGRSKDWPSMLWVATLGGIVRKVVFSPDDQSIAACSRDGTMTIFDAKMGVMEMRLRGHTAGVWAIAFSQNGKRLVSGCADCSVIIWDLKTGDIVGQPLTGHSGEVISVAYSSDGCFIASRSWDGEIRIFVVCTGARIYLSSSLYLLRSLPIWAI